MQNVDIGLQFVLNKLLPGLGIGVILPFFHSMRNFSLKIELLNNVHNSKGMIKKGSRNNLLLICDNPLGLTIFMLFIFYKQFLLLLHLNKNYLFLL